MLVGAYFETWLLKLKEEYRLRVFENWVLRGIFWPKRDEVTGQYRKLHKWSHKYFRKTSSAGLDQTC
jgi:hypothetical protein